MTKDTKKAAAYVPWKTLTNQLERFHSHGLPNQIDKTLFQSLAGGTRNELVAALKFLGLTDDEGIPTDSFKRLNAMDTAPRNAELKRIVQERYKPLFDLDLMKATPKQVEDKMEEEYGVTGSTHKKAMRFFYSAVRDLQIPVSRFLLSSKRSASTGGTSSPRRRKNSKKAASGKPPEAPRESVVPPVGASVKVVQLTKSEATITFTVSKDVLSLFPSDRKFVMGLVDSLEAYEQDALPSGGETEADSD